MVVEAGKAHKFANAGEDSAVMRVQFRPALQMERLFETAVALAQDGRVTGKGMPKPLDLALFVSEFKDEVCGPGSPRWLQRATLAPLAWIARRRGHGERYIAPVPSTPSRPANETPAGGRTAGQRRQRRGDDRLPGGPGGSIVASRRSGSQTPRIG